MSNKITSIHPSLFDSDSTGFQPTTNQNIHMNCNDDIKGHMSTWSRKITSVMDINRQRFSQINQKFNQRSVANLLQSVQSSHMYPIVLPQASRPQPRQQARSKQQIQTHLPLTQRSNTAHIRNQISNHQYVTLANLSTILHVLETQNKTHDSDVATQTSTSTTNSAKQRVQQHLQETAIRWWRPIRSSDYHSASSVIHTSATSTVRQQYPNDNNQSQENFPILTIVSNSTRQMNIPSIKDNGNSKYDESSTEIQTPTVKKTSFVSPTKTAIVQRTRQEPLIMQTYDMDSHSCEHRYYINHYNMNVFQQQRLIRQT